MNFPLFQRFTSLTDPTPRKIAHDTPDATTLVSDALTDHLRMCAPQQEIIIVCIGTDRSTGDCLGPLVGTQLAKYESSHYTILGTLSQPVHAMNLQDTMSFLKTEHPNSFIIAVDACLGQSTSIGNIQVLTGPVRPGAGVNKQLPPVGDMHITGIVNIGGFMEYFVLQNTRLHLVMEMATVIAHALHRSITRIHTVTH